MDFFVFDEEIEVYYFGYVLVGDDDGEFVIVENFEGFVCVGCGDDLIFFVFECFF